MAPRLSPKPPIEDGTPLADIKHSSALKVCMAERNPVCLV
jgi:hypothetical protein